MEKLPRRHRLRKAIIIVLVLLLAGALALLLPWLLQRSAPDAYLPQSSVVCVEVASLGQLYTTSLDSRSFDRLVGNLGIRGLYTMQLELRSMLEGHKDLLAAFLDVPLAASLDDEQRPLILIDTGWRGIFLQTLPLVQPLVNVPGLSMGKQIVQGRTVLEIAPANNGSLRWFVAYDRGILLASSDAAVLEAAFKAHDDPRLRQAWPLTDARRRLGDNYLIHSSFKASSLLGPLRKDNQLLAAFLDASATVDSGMAAFRLDDAGLDCKALIDLKGEAKAVNSLFAPAGEFQALGELPANTGFAVGMRISSLKELLDTGRTIDPQQVPDLKELDALSKQLLGKGLDELLYSWIGGDYLVATIGDAASPALSIAVKDTGKLEATLKTLASTIVLDIDQSLVLDGIRLPRLVIPPFWKSILQAFGMEMNLPYYAVEQGRLLLSEDPEVIAAMVKASRARTVLSRQPAFAGLKSRGGINGDFVLYYDAAIRQPSFLKSIPFLSGVLGTWRHGLSALSLDPDALRFSLQLSGNQSPVVTALPGYPLALERPSEARGNDLRPWLSLVNVLGGPHPEIVYPANDSTLIVADLAGRPVLELPVQGRSRLIPVLPGKRFLVLEDNGRLQRYSERNGSFATDGEAIETGIRSSFAPLAWQDRWLVYNDSTHSIDSIGPDGSISSHVVDISSPVLQPPALSGSDLVWFPRNLEGYFVARNLARDNQEDVMFRLGSMAATGAVFAPGGQKILIASEAGDLGIWPWPSPGGDPGFATSLGSPVRTQPVAWNKGFAVLSNDGTLRHLGTNGTILAARQVDDLAGDNAWLGAVPDSPYLYAGRGNQIRVFDQDLALVNGFPLPGGETRLFNLDGRGGPELVSVGYDGRIYAYELPETP